MKLTGKKSVLYLLLLIFPLISLLAVAKPAPAPQQGEKFKLIHSDKLFLSNVNEENVMELFGNVHFFYGKTEFKSNRAMIFDTQKIARLIGNVHVSNDTINIFSDSIAYYRIPEKLNMGGHVNITEKKTDGTFNRFTSDFGTYDKINDVVTSTGRVTGFSLTEKAKASCNYAFWDRKAGYGYLLENPKLRAEGKDTLNISSEKMEFFDADHKVICTFNVLAESKDYKATSDFLMYFMKEDKAVFVGEPRFTSDFANATATEFYLYMKDRKLHKAELKDSCLVYFASERGLPKVNWVKASFISMNMGEDVLKDFTAEDNVTYYYLQDQTDKQDYFANDASGSFLTATFKEDGKLNRMRMTKSIKGVYRFKNK
jgi:lipopolysaccharide export system protein LptA